MDISNMLQEFQAGAAQRVGNRRWWEELHQSDSEGSEQNEYRGDVERVADSEGSDGSSDEGPAGGGGGGGAAGPGSWWQEQQQQRQRHQGRKEGGSRRSRQGPGAGGAGGTRAAAAVASAAAGRQRQYQQQQLALSWQHGSIASGAALGSPPSARQQQARLPTSPLQGLTLNSPQQQQVQYHQSSQQYQQHSQQMPTPSQPPQQQPQPQQPQPPQQQDYTHCFKCGQPGM